MKYDIEILSQDEGVVIFFIEDAAYHVEIESEVMYEEYPMSFNSMNDQITWAESEVMYYRVNENTLYCDEIQFFSSIDICEQLEEMLNEN